MIGRTFAALIFGAASLIAASGAHAQQPNQLQQCRDEAIRRQISGDGLSQFLTQCMQQQAAPDTTASTDRQASYARCRSTMAAQGLTGDALYDAVGDCLYGSGSADVSTKGTYDQCRSQARAQGLSGQQVDEYINDCISQ